MRKVTVVFVPKKGRWMVRWLRDRNHQVRQYRKTEKAANELAAQIRAGFKGGISPDSVREYEAKKLLVLQENPNLDVDAVWAAGLEALRHKDSIGERGTNSIAELVPAFLASRKKNGCRQRTLDSYEGNLGVLGRMFPGAVSALQSATIEKTLNARELSRETCKSYARTLAVFCSWLGMSRNPARGLKFPRADTRSIEFFTRAEALILMEEARPVERGQLAIVLFVGVRPEASGLMRPDDIVQGKRITIRAEVSKDRIEHTLAASMVDRRKKVTTPGIPPNLWRWLEKFPFEAHSWTRLQNRLSSKVKKRGVEWKQDGTRHAFATHYYQLYGLDPTARMLTHSDLTLVRRHYAGKADAAEAQAYFDLNPEDLSPKANTDDRIRIGKVVAWPTDEQLRVMVTERPLVAIARELSISDVALAKRCRARGIPTPTRGHWTRVRMGS